MIDLINLLQSTDANVAVTIGLQDLREAAAHFAEQVAERLLAGTASSQTDDMMTAKEVSGMLGVTKQTLWRWDKMGYLKKVRVGNTVRYRRTDVEAIMNK